MRTLGLDLGTSSIGWAIVDRQGARSSLVDKGVMIFEKGVGEEKNSEYSLAGKRTGTAPLVGLNSAANCESSRHLKCCFKMICVPA